MNEAIMKKSFCAYCGTKYDEGAAFCHHCGVAVEVSDSSTTSPASPRRIIYDGQIYKCPNCGDIIDSFESYCHMCGYELRDTKPSSIIRELTSRLETIDEDIEKNKPKDFLATLKCELFDISDAGRKVNLIKNYPIPNTKEDMLELMIFATSHIDLDAFDGMKWTSYRNPEVSHAWYSMVKRIYEKARVSDFQDGTFLDIKQLYDECEKKVRKAKLGPWKYLGVCIGLFFLAILVLTVPQAFSKPDTSEYIVTEEARLDRKSVV